MWKRKTREQAARYVNNVPPLTAEIEREVLAMLGWVFGVSLDAEPISDEAALAQEWTREGHTGGWFWLNWRNYSYQALRTGDRVKRERIRKELRYAAVTQVHGNPHPFWHWLISSCDAAGSDGNDSSLASPRTVTHPQLPASADLLRQIREEQERSARELERTDPILAVIVRRQNESPSRPW